MNLKLPKGHKGYTKGHWKDYGLIWTSKEEFEEIYQRVIDSSHCELCEKPYKSNFDRQMDHKHCIDDKWGWFRNVICNSCNQRRSDKKIASDNTSGYIGICKHITKKCKQGFIWQFEAMVEGKQKKIKTSADFDKLVKFANQWKIENKYNT
tara:strand:+ start:61 stop:513 length:453 start_codon:yes stop_codon:yes gene_type:complete